MTHQSVETTFHRVMYEQLSWGLIIDCNHLRKGVGSRNSKTACSRNLQLLAKCRLCNLSRVACWYQIFISMLCMYIGLFLAVAHCASWVCSLHTCVVSLIFNHLCSFAEYEADEYDKSAIKAECTERFLLPLSQTSLYVWCTWSSAVLSSLHKPR